MFIISNQYPNMRKLKLTLFFALLIVFSQLSAQTVQLEGYAYESGNRGFLNLVSIKVYDTSNRMITSTASDLSGIFNLDLPVGQDLIIEATKDVFKDKKMAVSTIGKQAGEKLYLKVEMQRQPGYLFDVTLAAKATEKQIKEGIYPEGITDARIEVYNNSKKKQTLDLQSYAQPNFKVRFEDGNHYTILIRKKGFFSKRMEAYVNVEGCILCFDGVGEVKPGVSDVLTEENSMGTLLANVELVPIEVDKAIKVEKIYYDKSSAKIRKDAAEELDKLITVLEDNPTLIIELSSHTDARGDSKFNQGLSQRRAESAVAYILNNSDIPEFRIKAKGYGESKLVNSCGNGVECSERRHQMNRRTEIKVTGILSDDPYAGKSLADIKEEEQMEALLEELMNQEVVEVKAGEELPDEIAAQMEGKKEPEPIKEKVEEEMKKEEPVEEVIEQVELISVPVRNAADEAKAKVEAPIAKTEERIEEAKKEMNVEIKEELVTKPPVTQPSAPVYRKPPAKKEASEVASETVATASENLIVDNLEVNVNHQPSIARYMESGFSGYMVEFLTANNELSSNHEVFKKHGKIYKEQKKDGSFAYLFGPFEEWRDANRFLESAIKDNYKNAAVIRYKKGKRIIP